MLLCQVQLSTHTQFVVWILRITASGIPMPSEVPIPVSIGYHPDLLIHQDGRTIFSWPLVRPCWQSSPPTVLLLVSIGRTLLLVPNHLEGFSQLPGSVSATINADDEGPPPYPLSASTPDLVHVSTVISQVVRPQGLLTCAQPLASWAEAPCNDLKTICLHFVSPGSSYQ